jgi:hypothetical protein
MNIGALRVDAFGDIGEQTYAKGVVALASRTGMPGRDAPLAMRCSRCRPVNHRCLPYSGTLLVGEDFQAECSLLPK